MKQPTKEQTDALLRERLNRETARLPWIELQRHFAAGNVIQVAAGLDLIEIGVQFANDDKQALAPLIEQGRIGKVGDAQAQAWLEADASLWTMVIAPFVLVQESKSAH
jgi:hypothetical protein